MVDDTDAEEVVDDMEVVEDVVEREQNPQVTSQIPFLLHVGQNSQSH